MEVKPTVIVIGLNVREAEGYARALDRRPGQRVKVMSVQHAGSHGLRGVRDAEIHVLPRCWSARPGHADALRHALNYFEIADTGVTIKNGES